MNDKERLLELLKDKSLEVRPVTLSSGKISDYYMDCKRVTLSPEGAYLTGKLMLEMIRPEVSAVGGLTLGADPIVSSISVLSHLQKRDLAGLIVRKEPKKHGTMSYVEGPALQKGAMVAVVEDVVTSGASLLRAIDRIAGRRLPACAGSDHTGPPGRRKRSHRRARICAASALYSRRFGYKEKQITKQIKLYKFC